MRKELTGILLGQIRMAQCPTFLKTGRPATKVNADTVDDKPFLSLDALKAKMSPLKMYEKGRSPVSEDLLASFLAKPTPKPEMPAAEAAVDERLSVESEVAAVNVADNISAAEEMIVLLREKDVKELERRLHLIEGNVDLLDAVRVLLAKAVERFQLGRSLPDAFKARLGMVAE
jgi:hypothetical protein